MKKTYSKPEILFESFALSTSIAAGCEGIVGAPNVDECGVITSSGDTIFIAGVCDLAIPDDGSFKDGFCYHVPTSYNNLFNS